MFRGLMILAGLLTGLSALADGFSGKRVDGHAPIHVMGDHVHSKGEWMLSYRAMYMTMDQNYNGSSKVDVDEALAASDRYMMAPKEMTMLMHMFGGMYASSDTFTWMLMVPYIDNDMTMKNRMGKEPTSSTKGLGDLKFGSLVSLWHNDTSKLHLNLSLSAPTGAVDEKNHMGQAPYPMQLGSGTWDLLVGATYNQQWVDYSVGAQFMTTVRTGSNDQGYRLGNQYQLNAWFAKPVYEKLSLALSLDYKITGNISGRDKDIAMIMTPTADPDLRGGQRLLVGVGVNTLLPKGNRLALDYQVPVYQDLDGPQLGTEQVLTAGWQLSF